VINVLQITKYDNALFEDGVYQRQEWTSFFDIGRKFYDGVLTEEAYLTVENRYLDAAQFFAQRCPPSSLKISYLENRERHNFSVGQNLSIGQLRLFLQLCLRDKLWGRVRYGDQFFINTGYEYYMYIGFPSDWDIDYAYIKRLGLYYKDVTYKLTATDDFDDPSD
jgi:hypothetical protein